MRTFLIIAAALVALAAHGGRAMAQERPAGDEEARKAMALYFGAWNTADNEKVRATLNFPFVTLGGRGSMVIDSTPADYKTDFEAVKRSAGWHHSVLDSLEPLSSSADKVVFHVTFGRYKEDNTRYMTGHMIYIVTKKGDHWGPQFRTTYSAPAAAAAK